MAECSDVERELLDAISGKESGWGSFRELRHRLCISKCSPSLREALVAAHASVLKAHAQNDEAWEAFNRVTGFPGGTSEAFDMFYDSIEKEAKARL